MKIPKLDYEAIKAAVRTSGALMVGNVFVNAALSENVVWRNLGILLIIGVFVIIAVSILKEKK
jgi:hypothetical protein